jgi:hypothetical protein
VKQKRSIDFNLTCVFGRGGTRIDTSQITMLTAAQGLPMTSAAALRTLCGKPGAAKKALKAIDSSNVHAARAEAAELLGDALTTAEAGHGNNTDDEGECEMHAATCAPPTHPLLLP